MPNNDFNRLILVLGLLRACHAQILDYLDEVSAIAGRLSRAAVPGGNEPPRPALAGGLRMDAASFTVIWGGNACHLGYTLAYRLMEHLARRHDQYVPIDALLNAIWSGRRSGSAVRTAVADLRRRLNAAGMADLASRIDGRNRRHYGLMLGHP